MPEGEGKLEHCPGCGVALDVSEQSPFTKVTCPRCRSRHRVKCRFGPYLLQSRLAVGGMCRVFMARDLTLDREVVVKILHEDYSVDGNRIRSFEREARVTAAISHPHVVRVLTTGRAFGRFYIAMEFVSGGHFEQHIQERGRIPEDEALRLALQVAEGLDAANRAGLIHRDVKPANILLDAHGNAKLVDFGLSLVTRAGKARANEIWATPHYVPPEAIAGGEEDFRSDIYALGASFYHALAGQPPCNETTLDGDRLLEVKRKTPPLRRVAPHVSRATGALIDRCMSYDASGRYDSYAELMTALQRAAGGAGRGGARPGVGAWSRRRVRVVSLLATATAVLGFVIHRQSAERAPAPVHPPEVVSRPAARGASSPRSDPRAVLGLYREARQALASGDFDVAADRFSQVSKHPDVLEPTASLAACEAVVARLAEGRGDAAREAAKAALEHIRGSATLSPGLARGLKEQLLAFDGPRPTTVPEVFADSPQRSVSWMTTALQNWQLGRFDLAEPLLRAVADERGGDEVYPMLAARYLGDLGRLRAAEPSSIELGEVERREKRVELEVLLTELQTRGRAAFDVGCWIEDLDRLPLAEKDEAELAGEESHESLTSGRPRKLDDSLARGDFSEALALIDGWQPGDPSEEEERRALGSLATGARGFLEDLGKRISGRETILVTCDGRRLSGVVAADERMVRMRAAGGGEVSLAWSEIDPSCLIGIYRGTVDRKSPESERIRRHEQALAYDLLVGDSVRARTAAQRLGEFSEAFRLRWESMSSVWSR